VAAVHTEHAVEHLGSFLNEERGFAVDAAAVREEGVADGFAGVGWDDGVEA
jgi:hypothetical protein